MLICMPSRFGDPDTLLNEALGGQAQKMHGLAWAAMLWFCQAQQNTLTGRPRRWCRALLPMLICMPSRFGDPDTLLNEALGGQAQKMHGLAWAAKCKCCFLHCTWGGRWQSRCSGLALLQFPRFGTRFMSSSLAFVAAGER